MAATILLIRHAATAHVGRVLTGRAPGIRLDARGRAEAEALAADLAKPPLTAVVSSPLERARETAAPVAAAHGLDVRTDEAFHEVDVGDWTGRVFDALEGDASWWRWNSFRSSARPPGGESIVEVLARALAGAAGLAERHPGGRIAVVTHGDVIRPLLAHFLGMPLDFFLRIDIDPASVSEVDLHETGVRVRGVNRPPFRCAR